MKNLHPDFEYLSLLQNIEQNGVDKGDRTGTGTRSVFGTRMEFDLTNNKVPLLTTKKVFTKGIIHELIWMLSGDTNIRYLKKHGVDIWDSWIDPATAEYVDLTYEEKEAIADKEMGSISTYQNVIQRMKEEAGADVNKFKDLMAEYWSNNDVPSRRLVAGELHDIYQKQWRRWDDTRVVKMKDVKRMEKMGFTAKGFVYNVPAFAVTPHDYSKPLTDIQVVLDPYSNVVMSREIDQIQNVIDRLKTNPDCRRIIVSAWNVGEIDGMSLPPCHAFFQFWTRKLTEDERWALLPDSVKKDDVTLKTDLQLAEIAKYGFPHALCNEHNVPKRALTCQLYQRSCDVPLGVPFNIVQYSLLTHMVAQCVGMVAERFVWTGGDTHIYRGQEEGVKEQLSREPFDECATVKLNPNIKNIFDFTADDIEIKDYISHPAIKFPKAAV